MAPPMLARYWAAIVDGSGFPLFECAQGDERDETVKAALLAFQLYIGERVQEGDITTAVALRNTELGVAVYDRDTPLDGDGKNRPFVWSGFTVPRALSYGRS